MIELTHFLLVPFGLDVEHSHDTKYRRPEHNNLLAHNNPPGNQRNFPEQTQEKLQAECLELGVSKKASWFLSFYSRVRESDVWVCEKQKLIFHCPTIINQNPSSSYLRVELFISVERHLHTYVVYMRIRSIYCPLVSVAEGQTIIDSFDYTT